MTKIKIKGLDEAQRKLEQMQKGLKELDGKHSVSFAELFPSDFMCKYTKFSSMSELLDNGGFHVGSQEDFRNIPNEPFDRHIAATTRFKTWEEMLHTAVKEYAARKLGL